MDNAKKHWKYILGAGEKYVKPYRDEADIIINGNSDLNYFTQILEYFYTITKSLLASKTCLLYDFVGFIAG